MDSAGPGGKGLFRMLQPLILASSSPRRRELLALMGLTFEVIPSGVEENGGDAEPPELVKKWSKDKATAVARLHPGAWILAADTIVVVEGEIFGKPANSVEAASMLQRLSGRMHEVISGICLTHQDLHYLRVDAIMTQVRFKELTAEEVRAYVNTGEPLDKAGAYGIQGLGAFLVKAIYGSYSNVVGLPVSETLEWLLSQKVIALTC